jgi:hypothetical protein
VGRRISAATILALAAAAVFAVALATAVTRAGDASTPAVHRSSPAAPSPNGPGTRTPTMPATASAAAPVPATRPPEVLGVSKRRGAPAGRLPFTGPPPVAPSIASALLLLATGTWLLTAPRPTTGYDASAPSSTPERKPRTVGAIDRLRSPAR